MPEAPSSPTFSTIPQLIESAAKQHGERLFLEEPATAEHSATALSFSDFASETRRVTAALIASGVKVGDRIAVWAPNIHEWIVAALGAQAAGAVLVTLNTRYKGSEAAYILEQSGASQLFCIGNFLDTDYPASLDPHALPALQEIIVLRGEASPEGRYRQSTWQDFLTRGEHIDQMRIEARQNEVEAEHISDILFTSGTTGNPKGVMTNHGQNLHAFEIYSQILDLKTTDRYLVINPFFHSFGYKAGILACLISGTCLLPHAVFDAGEILERIARDRITVMPGPPTLFQSLLSHPNFADHDVSSLRAASTGAASIPVELIRQMRSTLGFERVITAYGLTESCGLVSMTRADDSAEIVAETSGRAIPGIELSCVDPNGQPVAAGEAGEIVVRGFNVMQGYFENPEASSATIDSDGWLHTGDIGNLDEAGNLRITDRLKDMFITGGFNCYPAEIENALAEHPAIAMTAVIGAPDQRMGEVAAAFVVLAPDSKLQAEELISWCRERMANYKVPRQVRFVDALPLNAAGKVLKTELRQQLK